MASAQDAELFQLPEELPALYWLQHWETARKNWKALALFCAAGVFLGGLIAACQPVLFHAAASLEIQGITDNFLKSQDGNPNAGADAELMDMQTQIRIMQSGSVVDGVVRAMVNHEPLARAQAVHDAERSLNVHAAGPTRIIEIAADSSDPRIAADFVNALASAYIDQHVEARWQGAERSAGRLQSALGDMRAKLENSEAALQDYARTSGLQLSGDRSAVSQDKLRLLQAELAQAQADRVLKQSRAEAVQAATDAALPAIAATPASLDAELKLTDLRRQLAELNTVYTADYSKVRRVRAQMGPLEAALNKERTDARTRARSDFNEARQRENLLAAANRAELDTLSADAQKKVHYDALRREVDATRALYDTLLARAKEAALGSAMRASNVRVLDAAKAATAPFQPRGARLASLGGLAGLLLGMGFATTRRQTDRSITTTDDLRRLLQVPAFGGVAALRASLAMADTAAQAQPPVRVLVIASAEPGEGKSTVAAELARAMAEIGRRVLLIDGDLHASCLHTLLLTPSETGLIDLLASAGPLLDLQIAQTLRRTAQPSLELLPAGAARAGASDFLYSSRLPELMAYGRKNFDIVLIDSPPMVQIPDARILGRAADAVLLVVRAGKTAREPVLAARQQFLEDKTPMTGCLLNQWDTRLRMPDRKPGRIPGISSLANRHPA